MSQATTDTLRQSAFVAMQALGAAQDAFETARIRFRFYCCSDEVDCGLEAARHYRAAGRRLAAAGDSLDAALRHLEEARDLP